MPDMQRVAEVVGYIFAGCLALVLICLTVASISSWNEAAALVKSLQERQRTLSHEVWEVKEALKKKKKGKK